MEINDKHEIANFLNRNDVGKLFKQLIVEIIAREKDLTNLKGREPQVVLGAVDMFLEFINEIFSAEDDFDYHVQAQEKLKEQEEAYIYKTRE